MNSTIIERTSLFLMNAAKKDEHKSIWAQSKNVLSVSGNVLTYVDIFE